MMKTRENVNMLVGQWIVAGDNNAQTEITLHRARTIGQDGQCHFGVVVFRWRSTDGHRVHSYAARNSQWNSWTRTWWKSTTGWARLLHRILLNLLRRRTGSHLFWSLHWSSKSNFWQCSCRYYFILLNLLPVILLDRAVWSLNAINCAD